MKELVETLVKALVKNPDAVTVTILQKGSLEIYQVHVAPEDMGKVIGSQHNFFVCCWAHHLKQ